MLTRRSLFKTAAMPIAAKPLQTVIEPPQEEWQAFGDPLMSVMRKLKNKLLDPVNTPKYIFGARERVPCDEDDEWDE